MGLDILIRSNKNIDSSDVEENQHSLSRTFCNFMCRGNVVNNPELDQIGKLLGIDISPLYDMENYDEDDEWLEFVDSEDEKQELLLKKQNAFDELSDNIDAVSNVINLLISQLSAIDNLAQLLNDNDYDTIGYEKYFSEFNKNKGSGYIGNNFGQDLRNFKSYLEFAKAKGVTTVWFSYG